MSRPWGVGRRIVDVWREETSAFVGLCGVLLPVGLATTTCLFGIPIMVWALGHLSRSALRGAKAAHGDPEPVVGDGNWHPGALGYLGLASVVAGAVLLAMVVLHLLGPDASDGVRMAAGLASVLVASMGIGAALAPLSLAPFVVADGVGGLLRPLSRSFELVSRRGPGSTALMGAMAGGAIGASLVLVVAVFGWTTPDVDAPSVAILAAPFGLVPGPALAWALLADAYVGVRGGVGREGVRPVGEEPGAAAELRLSARLKALIGLLVPVATGLGVALAVAAVTPLPMRPLDSLPGADGGEQHVFAEPTQRRLPGTSVTARTTDHGVVVEAEDGGGAGDVDAELDTAQSTLLVRRAEALGGPAGAHAVVVVADEGQAVTFVDDDGVRLDDGLGARVLGRLGVVGIGALLLGLMSTLALVWIVASRLGQARALEAPALMEEREHDAGLKALSGILRVADGGAVRPRDGRLVVDGEAWVEADGGALRFRLPERPVSLVAGEGASRDGHTVTIVSRFDAVSPANLRQAWTPWPPDGRLVLGTRDDAARALVADAARTASVFAVPALLALGAATGVLATAL
ncbi:MAG TPA: hypothetical protein RMH99_08840 [Sandaracinaceae bacterium LLY-WYZ-13_1]|nr:hypothetical protein [Sandaracinaceae bacterium LLY-WYZ-13_1]